MKGVYVLVILIRRDAKIKIGALGVVNFEKGLYVYVGSAQRSLERRIERDLRRTKRKFWHIDYLLDDSNAEVSKVFYENAGKAEECRIANKIGERGVSTKGFGSSDCKCKSHLFKIDDCQFLREFLHETSLI